MDTCGVLRATILLNRCTRGSPFRRQANIKALVLIILNTWLLTGWDHMVAHIESCMMCPLIRWAVWRLFNPLVDQFFGPTIYWAWCTPCSFDYWLLDATSTTVQALVQYLSLVREVSWAWLVGLGRVAIRTALSHLLRLLKPLLRLNKYMNEQKSELNKNRVLYS